MDIKLLVDKWLSNKKKIRGLKDQLREVQLEKRRDEASITKHLVEHNTEETLTIVSELHKKEVRIEKYQIEKLFPIRTVERKLIFEELEKSSLTKDFMILNTFKIHKYLKGKINQAHKTFIKTIRDLGLTQKSESIKFEVKDISSNDEGLPSLLDKLQSSPNDITLNNRDYETDEDSQDLEFHYLKNVVFWDSYQKELDKEEEDNSYQEELDKEEDEPPTQCLNCFNDVDTYSDDEELSYDPELCIQCNQSNEVRDDPEERLIENEMIEEIAGQTKYHLDPYDDAEDEQGFQSSQYEPADDTEE